jgi:chromosome segregation ATPase
MAKLRGMWSWTLIGTMCAAAGCVTQGQYDAIARANLQLQDKLAASQADRVKARTQVALLRQELVQSKQAQQEAGDRLETVTVEADTLRSRLDLQAKQPNRPAPASQPAVTRPAR